MQNKEFEATEERKRKAKQLDLQRKEMSRNSTGMGGGMGSSGRSSTPRTPQFPTYNPPSKPSSDSYDSYEAEKKKTFSSAPKGKGMQLGRKSKTTDMFERVRGELGASAEERTPLVSSTPTQEVVSPTRTSFSGDRKAIQIIISEQISVSLNREGGVKSFEVKGDLQLRILDPALSKVKLNVTAEHPDAQFRTHPKVDKALFSSQSIIQLKDQEQGFPVNQQIGVLRWRTTTGDAPLAFTIWVNQGPSAGKYTVTVEYELASEDTLRDVVVSIPFRRDEPTVTSMDEVYEVAGDSLDWTIASISENNSTGNFDFEAEAEEDSEFFPMTVRFRKEKPIVPVNVSSQKLQRFRFEHLLLPLALIRVTDCFQVLGVTLTEMGESVDFSKEVKVVAESYVIS